MSITADALRKLAALGLSSEQMSGVLSVLADVEAAEERRKQGQRERTRKHRERNVTATDCNVTVTVTETVTPPVSPPNPPPTPSLNTPPIIPPDTSSAREPDEAGAAFEAYNAAASAAGWPKATSLNAARRASLKARIRDAGGLDGWKAAMVRARGSPFLTGQNDRGWLPDLNFFLQPKSFTRLIEGAYDRRTSSHSQRQAGRPGSVDIGSAVNSIFGGSDGAGGQQVVPTTDFGDGPCLDFEASGGSFRAVGGWS